MHVKKTPLRKCTGCGEMKPKKELVRVVKSPEGEVSLYLTGRNDRIEELFDAIWQQFAPLWLG